MATAEHETEHRPLWGSQTHAAGSGGQALFLLILADFVQLLQGPELPLDGDFLLWEQLETTHYAATA